MAKKVLIISTSLRGKSNSEILAKECEKGAWDAGHNVEFLSLRGKDIRFCSGCLSCQKTGSCVLKDDVPEIMAKVKEAEVVVFAMPIYYYEMSGQNLKAVFLAAASMLPGRLCSMQRPCSRHTTLGGMCKG